MKMSVIPSCLELLAWLGLTPEDFNVSQAQFDHRSQIHGPSHVYRVMLEVLFIAWLRQEPQAGRLAFFGAFIHDFGRTNDAVDPFHGQTAAERKMPLYEPLFRRYGTNDEELRWVRTAVTQHSLRETLPMTDPGWPVLAILKDADALDRCRFAGLDPNQLRYAESRALVELAEAICERSPWEEERDFTLREFIRWVE